MDIREVLSKNFVLVLDPTSRETGTIDVNSFLAEYGGYVKEICLVAKGENGRVSFQSSAAPSCDKADFLPAFTQLADDLDIRVYTMIHAFGDSYLAQDFNYSANRSGGVEIREFVCPSQTSYWRYLATVAREVSRYPVDGIILTELMYPRQEFCFCRRCRREFSELTGRSKDISFTDVQREPNTLRQFIDWRSDILLSAFREVREAARSERDNIEVGLVVAIDPETGWTKGVMPQFGLNLDQLVPLADHLIFHLMPFSPLYPEPGSAAWNNLVNALKVGSEKSYKKGLYIWGLEQEENISWLQQLKEDTKSSRIFARLDYPDNSNRKREIHRGLT